MIFNASKINKWSEKKHHFLYLESIQKSADGLKLTQSRSCVGLVTEIQAWLRLAMKLFLTQLNIDYLLLKDQTTWLKCITVQVTFLT